MADLSWLSDQQWAVTEPFISGKRGRKRRIRHDKRRFRERSRIEATTNRRKDFRRVATRYDKLAHNYMPQPSPSPPSSLSGADRFRC